MEIISDFIISAINNYLIKKLYIKKNILFFPQRESLMG